jgi:hypothetical protein
MTSRAGQQEIPGAVEQSHKIPAITRAAKAYVEARSAFQEAATDVAEKKAALIDVMKRNEKDSYMTKGMTIQLTHGKDGVKVKATEDVPVDSPDEE